jgi:hypothetical protein
LTRSPLRAARPDGPVTADDSGPRAGQRPPGRHDATMAEERSNHLRQPSGHPDSADARSSSRCSARPGSRSGKTAGGLSSRGGTHTATDLAPSRRRGGKVRHAHLEGVHGQSRRSARSNAVRVACSTSFNHHRSKIVVAPMIKSPTVSTTANRRPCRSAAALIPGPPLAAVRSARAARRLG